MSFSLLFDYQSLGPETAVVGFDGALYNIASGSPEQTILSLYSQYGIKCLEHIEGMFAICIWDAEAKKLLVARDRMGECTLYYAQTPKGIVISTSIKSILSDYLPLPQMNVQHFLEPMRFTGPVDVENTWIDQIKRILPGQYFEISQKGIKKSFYWKRTRTVGQSSEQTDSNKQTLSLLQEAVEKTFSGDKKVAVMLSGGIDSSAVAALAKINGHEVHAVTAGYAGSFSCDERSVARQFAKESGFIHYELELDENDYLHSFEELSAILDEPITDSAAIAQWCMFKKVKELGFDVLLCGMGGDELFYGYPAWNKLGESLRIRREHESIFPWNSTEKKKHYIKFILKNLKHVLYAGYPSKLEDRSYGWWIHDEYYRFIKDATLSLDGEKIKLSDYIIYKDYPPCPLGKELDLIYDDTIDRTMVGAYLFISKKLGDAAGLEIRSPFLDHNLIEYVMSLPLETKYFKGKPKQYLKNVLSGIVPDYILYANKRGFTPPDDYVKKVSDSHQYSFINSSCGFYNSALADNMLSNLWNIWEK